MVQSLHKMTVAVLDTADTNCADTNYRAVAFLGCKPNPFVKRRILRPPILRRMSTGNADEFPASVRPG
jgi:hypothetical protein